MNHSPEDDDSPAFSSESNSNIKRFIQIITIVTRTVFSPCQIVPYCAYPPMHGILYNEDATTRNRVTIFSNYTSGERTVEHNTVLIFDYYLSSVLTSAEKRSKELLIEEESREPLSSPDFTKSSCAALECCPPDVTHLFASWDTHYNSMGFHGDFMPRNSRLLRRSFFYLFISSLRESCVKICFFHQSRISCASV